MYLLIYVLFLLLHFRLRIDFRITLRNIFLLAHHGAILIGVVRLISAALVIYHSWVLVAKARLLDVAFDGCQVYSVGFAFLVIFEAIFLGVYGSKWCTVIPLF